MIHSLLSVDAHTAPLMDAGRFEFEHTAVTGRKPRRPEREIVPLRHARSSLRRGSIEKNRALAFTRPLEQVRADGIEPVVSRQSSRRIERLQLLQAGGRTRLNFLAYLIAGGSYATVDFDRTILCARELFWRRSPYSMCRDASAGDVPGRPI